MLTVRSAGEIAQAWRMSVARWTNTTPPPQLVIFPLMSSLFGAVVDQVPGVDEEQLHIDFGRYFVLWVQIAGYDKASARGGGAPMHVGEGCFYAWSAGSSPTPPARLPYISVQLCFSPALAV